MVDAWCGEAATLGQRFASVQVFENKGEMMGCSNPHPHGQIWASDFISDEVAAEDAHQRAWLAEHGRSLLLETVEREVSASERVVEANDHWLAFVPFWATWPFETLLVPRMPVARLSGLDPASRAALADILGKLTRRYDALFGAPFPYSMGWHGAPLTEARRRTGSFTRISTRHCYARRRCASSWSATKCSPRRSAT